MKDWGVIAKPTIMNDLDKFEAQLRSFQLFKYDLDKNLLPQVLQFGIIGRLSAIFYRSHQVKRLANDVSHL